MYDSIVNDNKSYFLDKYYGIISCRRPTKLNIYKKECDINLQKFIKKYDLFPRSQCYGIKESYKEELNTELHTNNYFRDVLLNVSDRISFLTILFQIYDYKYCKSYIKSLSDEDLKYEFKDNYPLLVHCLFMGGNNSKFAIYIIKRIGFDNVNREYYDEGCEYSDWNILKIIWFKNSEKILDLLIDNWSSDELYKTHINWFTEFYNYPMEEIDQNTLCKIAECAPIKYLIRQDRYGWTIIHLACIVKGTRLLKILNERLPQKAKTIKNYNNQYPRDLINTNDEYYDLKMEILKPQMPKNANSF